jgi:hypothetical protein
MTYNQWSRKFHDGKFTDWPTHKAEVMVGMSLAERIAWSILEDVTDRRGWRQEWDQFDTKIKNEIFAEHVKIVQDLLPVV